ncbi:hypothetical protein FQN49_003947, partial [Arthroderma sp. PD_2]
REQKIGSAVELAEKRLLAKVSMTEGRARNAQAKLEVVQKAATDTPQKAVVEVWEVAKVARPAPASQAATPRPAPQTPAATQSPAPAPAPQAAQQPAPQTPVAPATPAKPAMPTESQPTPTPAERPAQATQASQEQPIPQPGPQAPQQQGIPAPNLQAQRGQPGQPGQQPQQPQQAQQGQPASGLPNRPPQATHHPAAGSGPGVLRALQSGLPVARGGRGRGGPAGQVGQPHSVAGQQGPGHQQPQQGQQLGASRGHGVPRGGRGRGGQGRGGAQHVQTGNLPAGTSQSSPRGGRGGGLNVQARQFIPQGNKRTREDGAEAPDTGNGKRIRGGGGGSS